MDKRFRVTKNGYDKLKNELNNLVEVEYPKIAKAIGEARELGDLRENQDYTSSKEKQELLGIMISNLNRKLSNAMIVDIKDCAGDVVDFGAIAYLIDEDTNKSLYYQILSEYEADLEKKIISIESPIGLALIGKKVGDVVEIKIPSGTKVYEITKIEWGRLL
jgi:transcription elongation factor GreA